MMSHLVAIYQRQGSPDLVEAFVLRTLNELYPRYPNKFFLIDLTCRFISISRPKSIVAYLCLLLDYFDSSDNVIKSYAIKKVSLSAFLLVFILHFCGY